jgi:arylsulfatase A-like enzyme
MASYTSATMKRLSLVIPLLLCVSANLAGAREASPRPNVILMMADDLATEDLSCYGGTRIDTPHIDKLASQGIRLTDYYAGNPVCTPSRMALLSGAYPARLGWRWGVLGYGFARKTGMSPSVYTIAECFQDAGYRTAMTGKWHLGDEKMSPEHQGFASAYYIRMSNNLNRDMVRDGHLVQMDWDNRRLTEAFAEECIRVVNEDADKPFFLYVPWTAPHFPAQAHPNWKDKHEDEYVGVVEELDFRVGQVLDALATSGKAENTIVVFTSDNGRQKGQEGQDDHPPYRGMKWQSLEGGTRVPCMIRWPDQIRAGSTNPCIVSAMDLFPTLAEACGVKIDLPGTAQKLDGVSVWTTFVDRAAVHPRRELLYWHGKGQVTAIRIGDWKLYFNEGEKDPDVSEGPVFFNLKDDPKETNDLSAQHAEVVQQMLDRAKVLLTDIYANQLPLGMNEGVEHCDPPLKAVDVWGPFIK